MPLPNFLIIGAPKSGTTSLWHYVSQHPDVFANAKEPGYFWTFKPARKVQTLEEYESLFEGSEGFTAVGEGSPTYFSDPNAPERISELIPEAKLIAILRDPCDRAFSEFTFQRLRNDESVPDFLDAVAADADRTPGFGYIETGLYHRNLTRYLDFFDRSRLKVVFNEDLKMDRVRVVAEVFEFLGVDPTYDVDTDLELTASGVPKIKALHWLLGRNNPIRRTLIPLLPKGVTRIARRVRNANLDRQVMTPDERAAILPYFEEDIRRLEKLVDRDLGHWLDGPVGETG